jgi:hypothetical protein
VRNAPASQPQRVPPEPQRLLAGPQRPGAGIHAPAARSPAPSRRSATPRARHLHACSSIPSALAPIGNAPDPASTRLQLDLQRRRARCERLELGIHAPPRSTRNAAARGANTATPPSTRPQRHSRRRRANSERLEPGIHTPRRSTRTAATRGGNAAKPPSTRPRLDSHRRRACHPPPAGELPPQPRALPAPKHGIDVPAARLPAPGCHLYRSRPGGRMRTVAPKPLPARPARPTTGCRCRISALPRAIIE